MAENRKKKVVRVESDAAEVEEAAADWKPTPESKGKATTFRVIAAILWVLAIGAEAFAIFFVLRQDPVNMVLLIILLVVIGALAVGGSLLWKRANRLDPARKSDKVRFFVQNQLGAIITVIAFLPLIILIFTNKNMDGKQKGIAGAIAIVLLLVAGYFGTLAQPAVGRAVHRRDPDRRRADRPEPRVLDQVGRGLPPLRGRVRREPGFRRTTRSTPERWPTPTPTARSASPCRSIRSSSSAGSRRPRRASHGMGRSA